MRIAWLRGWRLGAVLGGVAVVVGFLLYGNQLVFRSSGLAKPALDDVEGCSLARAAIGDHVHLSPGASWGHYENQRAFGFASWSVPVTGSHGSGRLELDEEQHGGRWRTTRELLVVGNQTIDIRTCPPVYAPVREAGAAAPPAAAYLRTSLGQRCDHAQGFACLALGAIYEAGEGVAPDRAKAHELYERGCATHFAPACDAAGEPAP